MKGEVLRRHLARAGGALTEDHLTIAIVEGGKEMDRRDATARTWAVEPPLEAWHKFAVQIELRVRTLKASIAAHGSASLAIQSQIALLNIEAHKLEKLLQGGGK